MKIKIEFEINNTNENTEAIKEEMKDVILDYIDEEAKNIVVEVINED